MPQEIEAVISAKNKRTNAYEAWQAYQELYTPQKNIELTAPQRSTDSKHSLDSVDTLKQTHSPKQYVAQNTTQEVQKPKLASSSPEASFFDSIIDMGKELWNWISQAFTSNQQ